MCGIEGSETEHAVAFEQLVLEVLKDVAENGVPQEQLEASCTNWSCNSGKSAATPTPMACN